MGTSLSNRTFGQLVGEETHTMQVTELVSHNHTGTTVSNGDHTHTGSTNTTGDHSHTHNANGGNLGLTVANGLNTVTNTDNSGGEINVWTSPQALSVNSNGSHSHSVTNTNNGSHTHTFTSNNTGGTQPFNVMQPTIFIGNVFIYYGHKEDAVVVEEDPTKTKT